MSGPEALGIVDLEIDPSELAALAEIRPKRVAPHPHQDIPAVLRHSHHQMARLIAIGTKVADVALITGYSPGYISSLKGDPAFAELISHYHEKQDEIFVDAIKRLKELGLVALEVALERISTDDKQWTRKDILEVIELAFGKGAGLGLDGRSGVGGKAVPPVAIEVTFVQAPEMRGPELDHRERQGRLTIEGQAREIEPA
jgi:hypothetical protein